MNQVHPQNANKCPTDLSPFHSRYNIEHIVDAKLNIISHFKLHLTVKYV